MGWEFETSSGHHSGAITPITHWLHYGDHVVAPLRRSFTGAITPIPVWLHRGDP
jgi:hypothetical protein